jgi:predicted GNAT family acetyltransferase
VGGVAETTVTENPAESRFELRLDGELVGYSEYRPGGDSVVISHTEIEEGHEGEGLGSTLVREMLDELRRQGKTVIPTCQFTAAFIRRHQEYLDLVEPVMRRGLGG